MRRIPVIHMSKDWEQLMAHEKGHDLHCPCDIISRRDLKLLMGVAREVEKYQALGYWSPVLNAIDALNEPKAGA